MPDMTVIDGGMATELVNLGHAIDGHPLWSASLLPTDGEAILEVHKRYLKSGADVVTSASYQASIEGFQKYLGLKVSEAEELIMKSVKLAKQACDSFMQEVAKGTHSSLTERRVPLVAGSVGPYAVLLADGSEYTGNYINNVSCEELIDWHRPRVKCLVDAGCDLLAFETIPAWKEGLALVKLLREFPNSKAWLSFCCQDPHSTAHNENFASAVTDCLKMVPSSQLVAVGTNCCPPAYVQPLLSDLTDLPPDVAKLAYPNSGEEWESKKGWTKQKEMGSIESFVQEWIFAGGQWLGGCCRTTPSDIEAISRKLHYSMK